LLTISSAIVVPATTTTHSIQAAVSVHPGWVVACRQPTSSSVATKITTHEPTVNAHPSQVVGVAP
jgi:hypothetical protein